jgi:hypothetical protein
MFLFPSQFSLLVEIASVFSSSQNSRQDRELFQVPESRCREGDENFFSREFWELLRNGGKIMMLSPKAITLISLRSKAIVKSI